MLVSSSVLVVTATVVSLTEREGDEGVLAMVENLQHRRKSIIEKREDALQSRNTSRLLELRLIACLRLFADITKALISFR